MTYTEIQARYAALNLTIEKAQKETGVATSPITLIAVTKQQSIQNIRALLDLQHYTYAENRIAEAAQKWPALRAESPLIELHLIGALQTNKARAAVALFDVIETLDRPALADAIYKEALRVGKVQRCYIQINIGQEPQKSGVAPQDLLSLYKYACALSHITVEGLMCIPPEHLAPEPFFEKMHHYQQQLKLPCLSMGMSGDFISAIAHGATHVRIGTALMGEREVKTVK